jgi:uncharacterized protein YndB with AHSA1/START domain
MENKVEKSITINASPTRVWETLTRPELIKKYMFDSDVHTDWKKGSPILYTQQQDGKTIPRVNGTIRDILAPKLLKMNIVGVQEKYKMPVKMSYVLEPAGDHVTVLHIREEGFHEVDEGEKRYEQSLQGWEMVLPRLKEVAENDDYLDNVR